MLRLHGFPISNYHNRIKMALKIKGLAFEEVRAAPSKNEDYLKINPLGVIPTLEIDGVFFAETHPTLEYLEEAFPDTTPLMPKNAADRHRVRQLPAAVHVANPAFDVTPARLVTGLITERGVIAAETSALAAAFPDLALR